MEPIDLSIVGELRLDSVDHIAEDIDDLTGGFVWAIGKGLLGDLGDVATYRMILSATILLVILYKTRCKVISLHTANTLILLSFYHFYTIFLILNNTFENDVFTWCKVYLLYFSFMFQPKFQTPFVYFAIPIF